MRRSSFCVALLAVLLLGAVPAYAGLIKNLDGTVTETRNDGTRLMWLTDANYAQTSGYDADGRMSWAESMAWANNLNFAGYDDWRLPSARNFGSSGAWPDSYCWGYHCSQSEMGYLYFVELGNPVDGPMTNTGPFMNVQLLWYWNIESNSSGDGAFMFSPKFGSQGIDFKTAEIYAWAVRDVSPTPVPDPGSTLLLFGTGLVGLRACRKRGQ